MSTEFIINKRGEKEVSIVETSTTFCLDLWGYSEDGLDREEPLVEGPQRMSADEALNMAARIMYAVWCSYPVAANIMAQRLAHDIPTAYDHMPETGEQEPTQLPVLPASGGLERGY
jgi:hypothetical protein